MAARKTNHRGDEDALDPVEAADVEADDVDGPEVVDDEPELVEGDGLDDAAFEADDAFDEGDDEELTPDEDVAASDDDEVEHAAPLVAFDEDEDEEVEDLVAVVAEEDDDVDGLREGEFVCRSCFMAKRNSALADPKRLLCRDCA